MTSRVFPVVEEMVPLTEVLPHRAPMLLLDEMVSVDGGTVLCRTTIREDSTFLRDGTMPAIVGLEYMAQAVGAILGLWVLLEGGRVTGGLLLGAPSFELDVDHYEVGDVLDIRCTYAWGSGDLWKFDCAVERRGKSVSRANLNVLRIRPELEAVS